MRKQHLLIIFKCWLADRTTLFFLFSKHINVHHIFICSLYIYVRTFHSHCIFPYTWTCIYSYCKIRYVLFIVFFIFTSSHDILRLALSYIHAAFFWLWRTITNFHFSLSFKSNKKKTLYLHILTLYSSYRLISKLYSELYKRVSFSRYY